MGLSTSYPYSYYPQAHIYNSSQDMKFVELDTRHEGDNKFKQSDAIWCDIKSAAFTILDNEDVFFQLVRIIMS